MKAKRLAGLRFIVSPRASRACTAACPTGASGRQSVEPIEDGHFNVAADLVIKALGFDPEDIPAHFATHDLDVSRWGTVKIGSATFMTSLKGIFAAGDIVRGASLVVWAIRDGRDAAQQIHGFLQQITATAVAAE